MRWHQAELEKRNVQVVAISPAGGAPSESVCGMLNVPFPCLGDPSGEAYDAYGLGRAPVRKMLNFHTVFRGTLAFFKGFRQGQAVGDRFRLPGAFIISSGGKVRWMKRGRDAADHVRGADLLTALDSVDLN